MLASGMSLTKETEEHDCHSNDAASEMWSIVCEGYLSTIVGVLGLCANVVVIIILSKPMFKGIFNQLLISLSVFDLLFIGKRTYSKRYRIRS